MQVLLVGSLIGGPGFVSIPALMSSIRRDWAGLVPSIFQKNILMDVVCLVDIVVCVLSSVGIIVALGST